VPQLLPPPVLLLLLLLGAFLDLIQVLLALGREQEAAQLLERAHTVGPHRAGSRDNPWWGPSGAGGPAKKPKWSAGARTCMLVQAVA